MQPDGDEGIQSTQAMEIGREAETIGSVNDESKVIDDESHEGSREDYGVQVWCRNLPVHVIETLTIEQDLLDGWDHDDEAYLDTTLQDEGHAIKMYLSIVQGFVPSTLV